MAVQGQQQKLMLVTKTLDASPSGGREMLCKLNHDVLSDLHGDNFIVFELSNRPLSGSRAFANVFRGYIDGLDAKTLQPILTTIKKEQISKVFIDGSNLGVAVDIIKHQFPAVEVTTFFHNVEARFFWGSFATKKSFRALGVLMANFLAERKAVHGSDKIICLNDRDSRLLKRLYGRGAIHISPMALEDKIPHNFFEVSTEQLENFALFVGGTFYANQAGIEWFVREVVPCINMPICIVGRGFEALKSELEIPGKVTVVGAVDSLTEWYMRTQFVIAPIFEGSGMKTKVAEALMYGKKVVGTPEAFTGYEDIINQAGWVCSTVDDFVAAIVTAGKEIKTLFYPELREIYQNKYSLNAARVRMKKILEEPI